MLDTLPPFEGVPYTDLTPVDKHPGYRYMGFHPGKTVQLPRGHVLKEGFSAFRVDTALDIDSKVPMRDGISIYTNVYRPSGANAKPLPALIAWSPYGKCSGGEGPQRYDGMGPFHLGIPYDSLSGYETFEGPNPADWVARGYCIVDPDARGALMSEGNITFFGEQESRDVYDLIQWCTEQPWCDGTAVMFGNSWLAISQMNHASRTPHPALKAIAPWEAATDPYNDLFKRGGVTVREDRFAEIIIGGFAGLNKTENPYGTNETHPLNDEYWQAKYMDAANIKLPMYLTASYSSRIHSRASFESFAKAPRDTTWLRVHTTQEWHDLYQKRTMDDLQKFYDYFAKGIENDWKATPRLRLSLLSLAGSVASIVEERPYNAVTYPLPETQNRKLYLDNATKQLVPDPPSTAQPVVSYEAHSLTDEVSFTYVFDKYTELSGLPWARLYLSCNEHDDMDVHVIIRKTGISGKLLSYNIYPVPVPVHELPDINNCKYQGPNGVLRASHTISQLSKSHPDDYPVYSHSKREAIEPGHIVPVEIPIWPIGMVFEKGEGIAVVIAGHDLKLQELPQTLEKPNDENEGRHNIHSGGEHQSFVMLPFLEG